MNKKKENIHHNLYQCKNMFELCLKYQSLKHKMNECEKMNFKKKTYYYTCKLLQKIYEKEIYKNI